jgi:16S rRNA G1207 methylase RsmC
MVLPREGCVLDLGCGYGPVGIVAASSTPTLRVIMVDVNLRAVQLAKENAKRNGAENAEVRHGSLYEPVEDMQFAAVLCNPPISAGLQTVRSLVTGAPRHIESEGSLQMVVRSSKGGKRLTDLLKETFGNVTVLARASGYRVILSEKS